MAQHKCHQNARAIEETSRFGRYECEVCGNIWEEELGEHIESIESKLV